MTKYQILSLIILSLTSTLSSAEPANIGLMKQQLRRYHDSGAYIYEMRDIYQKAQHYAERRIEQNQASKHPKKLAIVMDIDDTVLSNYTYLDKGNFGFTYQSVNEYLAKGQETAIPPALEFFNFVKSQDVAIFFVTGRSIKYQKITEENLRSAGYFGWHKIIMHPSKYTEKSGSEYKIAIRKQIEDQGFDIIATIGDQWSDLKGGYADRGFKLPNPFYYLP